MPVRIFTRLIRICETAHTALRQYGFGGLLVATTSACDVAAFVPGPSLRCSISEAVPTCLPETKSDLIKRALRPFFGLREPKHSAVQVR